MFLLNILEKYFSQKSILSNIIINLRLFVRQKIIKYENTTNN